MKNIIALILCPEGKLYEFSTASGAISGLGLMKVSFKARLANNPSTIVVNNTPISKNLRLFNNMKSKTPVAAAIPYLPIKLKVSM